MPFPFSSWEYPRWRSEFLPHMSVQYNQHVLQLVCLDLTREWGPYQPDNRLFFRSLNLEESGSFVVTYPCESPFYDCILGTQGFGNPTISQLFTVLDEALLQGNFARLFFLDEDGQLRRDDENAQSAVIVGATGWGQWLRLKPEEENGFRFRKEGPHFPQSTAFRWTSEPDIGHFLLTSASKTWANIQEQTSNMDLDCALARRMLDLPEEEIDRLMWGWNKAKHAELYKVLRAAFLSQTEIWKTSKSYEWVIKLDKLKLPWHKGGLIPLQGTMKGYESDAPDTLRSVLRRVAPYFEPTSVAHYLAPQLELARRQRQSENALAIRVGNPTTQERREATVFWEAWLKSHPEIQAGRRTIIAASATLSKSPI